MIQKKKQPLYEQIYEALREAILQGRILQGEKLPSTRFEADYLQVSRSTVELAYDQLVSEGYIHAEPYRGYFACDVRELYDLTDIHTADTQSQSILTEIRSEIAAEKDQKETYRIDFSLNALALESFPYNGLSKIMKNLLLDEGEQIMSSGSAFGEANLKETICDYLFHARNVRCVPEQIVIGAGNEYLQLLLAQMLGKEHCVAMESPTYLRAYKTFRNIGFPVQEVVLDESGMRVDLLRETDASIAYVMPSHQFPLGIVMPMKRRLELLNWAMEEPERYIIEDDYDSEFRYKGKPIPALQGIDRFGRVIYLGTFSKSVAPAIRVSYMVLPEPLLAVYRERCGFYTSTVSRVDQEILTRFLRDGYFERHLNRMRGVYRMKHDLLLDLLGSFRADFRIQGELAGLHLLLESRKNTSEEELIARAWDAGVRVYGLSEYLIPAATLPKECFPPESRTILLGYAGLSADQIRDGAERLKRAWGIW